MVAREGHDSMQVSAGNKVKGGGVKQGKMSKEQKSRQRRHEREGREPQECNIRTAKVVRTHVHCRFAGKTFWQLR